MPTLWTMGSSSQRNIGISILFGGMAPLVQFLIVNFAGGFALGIAAGLGFLVANELIDLFATEPIAAGMILWSFGASFGAGAIGTGLAAFSGE